MTNHLRGLGYEVNPKRIRYIVGWSLSNMMTTRWKTTSATFRL